MNIISKESLSKMSIAELEGKLMQAKEDFKATSTTLSEERQKQILKTKNIRGNAAKRKQELIAQIMKINKATQKVHAQIERIQYGIVKEFKARKRSAAQKVRTRKQELKTTGTYQTSLSDMERIYAWCEDMDVSKEVLEKLLELYDVEELANMSGDDFYDKIEDTRHELSKDKSETPEPEPETSEPENRERGLKDLGIEDLGD